MWRLGLEISVYNRQFMGPMKLSPDKTAVGYNNKIKMMKTRPRKLAPRSFHCATLAQPL